MSGISAQDQEGVFIRRFGPSLCNYCNNLLISTESNLHLMRPDIEYPFHRTYVDYHPTINSLQNAVQSGCHLCLLFENRLRPKQSIYIEALSLNREPGSCRNYESIPWVKPMLMARRSFSHPYAISFHVCFGNRSGACISGAPQYYFAYPGTSDRTKVDKELTSMQAIRGLNYTPPSSTDNRQAWELCRSWIRNCIKNHDRCKGFRLGKWWPTRLLYVGRLDSSNIQLHLTSVKRPEGSYMTLSHCWGRGEMLKLEKNNLEHRLKHGFLYEELPKTFQDAIRLCRFLCYDYIWIDSLCIIQDSEDWIEESKAMSNIYQHSICNIAAAASQGPTEGCFYPRNPNRIPPLEIIFDKNKNSVATAIALLGSLNCCVRRSKKETENESIEKLPYLFVDIDIWNVNVEDAPLNKRAWVMQERALAPRQIHCGQEQLLWECRQTTACETFPFILDFYKDLLSDCSPIVTELTSLNLTLSEMSRVKASEVEPDGQFPQVSFDSSSLLRNHHGIGVPRFDRTLLHLEGATLDERVARLKHDIYNDWAGIIEIYSSCELTERTDRLVAISGIASRIQDVLDDENIAGLWRSQLHLQLLWSASRSSSHREIPDYKIGPSWSWSCLNAPVAICVTCFGQKTDILIDILDVQDGHTITRLTANSNKESPLKMRCLLYKVHSDSDGEPEEGPCVKLSDLPDLDTEENLDSSKLVYLLPILGCEKQELLGLLIVPIQRRPGFYRRIGTFDESYIDDIDDIMGDVMARPDGDKVLITLI
ncbi:heterokaryon incompatibility protein-domain-containing protein [Annulohypoxylon moriforme]|nr:heterokaryon incompatibility protein-domain-containing protein [Annulohypoxylon moriforme]